MRRGAGRRFHQVSGGSSADRSGLVEVGVRPCMPAVSAVAVARVAYIRHPWAPLDQRPPAGASLRQCLAAVLACHRQHAAWAPGRNLPAVRACRPECEFITSQPTIASGNLFHNAAVVQACPGGVRLLEGMTLLQARPPASPVLPAWKCCGSLCSVVCCTARGVHCAGMSLLQPCWRRTAGPKSHASCLCALPPCPL